MCEHEFEQPDYSMSELLGDPDDWPDYPPECEYFDDDDYGYDPVSEAAHEEF